MQKQASVTSTSVKVEKRKEFDASASNNMTIIIKQLPPAQEVRLMIEDIDRMDQ